jgi:hypothetical protein
LPRVMRIAQAICRRNPIRPDDEFSPRRLSITENERRSRVFGATNSPGCAAWPSSGAAHDAALEATMYPTICSYHASGGVIAEGLA